MFAANIITLAQAVRIVCEADENVLDI